MDKEQSKVFKGTPERSQATTGPEHIGTVLQGAFEERVRAIAGRRLKAYLDAQELKGMPSLYREPVAMDSTDSELQDIAEAIAIERNDLLIIDQAWRNTEKDMETADKTTSGLPMDIKDIKEGYTREIENLQEKVRERTAHIIYNNLTKVGKIKLDLKKDAHASYYRVVMAKIWRAIVDEDFWGNKTNGGMDLPRHKIKMLCEKCSELAYVYFGSYYATDTDLEALKQRMMGVADDTFKEMSWNKSKWGRHSAADLEKKISGKNKPEGDKVPAIPENGHGGQGPAQNGTRIEKLKKALAQRKPSNPKPVDMGVSVNVSQLAQTYGGQVNRTHRR